MWPRFTLYDVRVIGHYLGMLVLFSTFALLVPLVTALAFQEWEPASRYLLAVGVTLVVGSALRFLCIQPRRLTRQQAFIITGLAYLVLALLASIPLHLSGHYVKYLDVLFDTFSGLTTTGVSIIVDLDHLSYADNMWRFMMHLMGGLGVIVIGLAIGVFGKTGGASLFRSEGRQEHVVPNVAQTAKFIARIAAAFVALSTLIMGLLCMYQGIEANRAFLHALWLSISAFMTGGFAPMSSSIVYYHSFVIETVLVVVMLLGSVNFVLHAEILHGRVRNFFQDTETKAVMLWLALLVGIFAASVSVTGSFSDLPAMLRRDVFTVISAFSTTGFMNISPDQLTGTLTSGAFLAIAVLMAFGGGSGSTSGGIKLYRVALIVKSIIATVKQALSPDSARVVVSYNRVGRRIMTERIAREALLVAGLYTTTYLAGMLISIAHGYDASQAIFDSIAMASNAGLTSGIATPGMPFTLELWFILTMWAGRLEFIALLALLAKIVVSLVPRRLTTKVGKWQQHRREDY